MSTLYTDFLMALPFIIDIWNSVSGILTVSAVLFVAPPITAIVICGNMPKQAS
jgi:hypothetical protein